MNGPLNQDTVVRRVAEARKKGGVQAALAETIACAQELAVRAQYATTRIGATAETFTDPVRDTD